MQWYVENGDCEYIEDLEESVCRCYEQWIGDACNTPCINGTNNGDGKCTCFRTCDTGIITHLKLLQFALSWRL